MAGAAQCWIVCFQLCYASTKPTAAFNGCTVWLAAKTASTATQLCRRQSGQPREQPAALQPQPQARYTHCLLDTGEYLPLAHPRTGFCFTSSYSRPLHLACDDLVRQLHHLLRSVAESITANTTMETPAANSTCSKRECSKWSGRHRSGCGRSQVKMAMASECQLLL